MKYNDEKLMSPQEYEELAKAYSRSKNEHDLIFVSVGENPELINTCFELLCKIKSSLFALSNFLGTGKMYSLNERHIKLFQSLFPDCVVERYYLRTDKTKCFLNMLSLENQLIFNLIRLEENSVFFSQIEKIIEERLSLSAQLYKIKGLL